MPEIETTEFTTETMDRLAFYLEKLQKGDDSND